MLAWSQRLAGWRAAAPRRRPPAVARARPHQPPSNPPRLAHCSAGAPERPDAGGADFGNYSQLGWHQAHREDCDAGGAGGGCWCDEADWLNPDGDGFAYRLTGKIPFEWRDIYGVVTDCPLADSNYDGDYGFHTTSDVADPGCALNSMGDYDFFMQYFVGDDYSYEWQPGFGEEDRVLHNWKNTLESM